jgi:hypothetical protein
MKMISELFKYVDGNVVWIVKPYRGFSKHGKTAGQPNGQGYLEVKTKQLTGKTCVLQVHRIVWELHNGKIPQTMVVDHLNRDVSDNRIENLRLVTRSENSMNACGKSNKKSCLPKNVYVDWTYGNITKYRAQVMVCGKQYRVGGFDSPQDAMTAAGALRAQKHGAFQCSRDGVAQS